MPCLTSSCLLKASSLRFTAERKTALKMKAEVVTGSFQAGEDKWMKFPYIVPVSLSVFKKKINTVKNIFLSFIEFFGNICFQAAYPDTDFWQCAYVRGMCTSLRESVDKRKECQQEWEPSSHPHAYALTTCWMHLQIAVMSHSITK